MEELAMVGLSLGVGFGMARSCDYQITKVYGNAKPQQQSGLFVIKVSPTESYINRV